MKSKFILFIVLFVINTCFIISAQNSCAFSAGINKDQLINTGYSKVMWNYKQFDECNSMKSNGSFCPGSVGKYLLIASCYIDDMSHMSTSVIYVFKNGSCIYTGTNQVNSGGFSDQIHTINCIVEVQNPTDNFDVYIWHNSTMNAQIRCCNATFFQGYRISYY